MDHKGNLSTEHQRPGDAKQPSDTMDREQGSGNDNLGVNNDEDESSSDSGDNMGANQDEEDRQNHEAVHNGNRSAEAGAHDGVENQIHQSVRNQSVVTPEDYPERNSMRDADKG